MVWLPLSTSLSPSLSLAESFECRSEFRRWGEPAAGRGLSAKAPARVSTKLCCGPRGLRELPATAAQLHRGLAGLCEEACARVR